VTESSVRPILIVDDDAPTQRLLQAVLRKSSYPTETSPNGRAAIERLQAKQYAAVILDMMMPEAGGREVIDFLSAGAGTTPVIVCSAAAPNVFQNLDPNVVKAVVRKPFDVEQLLETVITIASRS